MVDIEFYGDKEKNLPSREEKGIILKELLRELEKYYGQKPIIYATLASYELYIEGEYEDYPIWVRDVTGYPVLDNGRKWTFWQYSNRGRLRGFESEEKYIDLNVFNGIFEEFTCFCTL